MFGVKSWPHMKYLSNDESGEPKVYTFSGDKGLSDLERFAIQNGYKDVDGEEIPTEIVLSSAIYTASSAFALLASALLLQ